MKHLKGAHDANTQLSLGPNCSRKPSNGVMRAAAPYLVECSRLQSTQAMPPASFASLSRVTETSTMGALVPSTAVSPTPAQAPSCHACHTRPPPCLPHAVWWLRSPLDNQTTWRMKWLMMALLLPSIKHYIRLSPTDYNLTDYAC
jgi:hypothetical protein